jgi:hypothetical protein
MMNAKAPMQSGARETRQQLEVNHVLESREAPTTTPRLTMAFNTVQIVNNFRFRLLDGNINGWRLVFGRKTFLKPSLLSEIGGIPVGCSLEDHAADWTSCDFSHLMIFLSETNLNL